MVLGLGDSKGINKSYRAIADRDQMPSAIATEILSYF